MRQSFRIAVIAGVLVALSGCRVDVTTSLRLDDSGAGAVTVDVIADADVLERIPDLATQLRLDDLTASGWETDGPVATDDGGLRVTLTHDVNGPEETTQVLGELNGPLGPYRGLRVARSVDDAAITTVLTGTLGVTDLGAFADDELQALVPDAPVKDLLTKPDGSAYELADVFGARLVVALPDTEGDTPSVTFDDDGMTDAQVFTMPSDGSVVDVTTRSITEVKAGMRAPFIALIALVALVAWIGLVIAFVRYVMRHRRTAVRPSV